MPYIPKVNVAVKARKDSSLINGMEIAVASVREQILNMMTYNGVINYTSNQVNKIVANEKIVVFCNDPNNKYPSLGFISTANAYNVVGVDFTLTETVALTAQFMQNNKPAAGVDVTVTVKTEKRVMKTNNEGKIVVSSKVIPVVANDVVMFEAMPAQSKPFQQNISFPATSVDVVFSFVAADDILININVQTGASCKESNIVLNAKNHIFKGTTKNCFITFSSPIASRWLVEGETYQYVAAALGFAEAKGYIQFA